MSSEYTPSADALDTFLSDSYTHVDPLSGIDPSFVLEFDAYDDLDDGQRWSTWLTVEPHQRGPEPWRREGRSTRVHGRAGLARCLCKGCR